MIKSKFVQQVKLYDKEGNPILIIENCNGAIGISLLDNKYTLKQELREKKEKISFVSLDELYPII